MDIRRADLPLLISLDALLEDRNVTRAARRLNVTQSTLSGHLARLREIFHDPLLVPAENGRGMIPTERALALQPSLHDALSELQSAVADNVGFDPTTSERTFVVAINDNAFTMVGMAAAQTIAKIGGPGIRTSFITPDLSTLSPRMERGDIDLYVGAARTLPGNLKQRALVTDCFCMAQRKGHPRGRRKPSLACYVGLDHMLVSPSGGFRSPVDDALAALGKERKVVLTVPTYIQAAMLLSRTDLVATLPSRLLGHYADLLDVFSIPIELRPFSLSISWHPRSHNNAAHKWLREQFISVAMHDADKPSQ